MLSSAKFFIAKYRVCAHACAKVKQHMSAIQRTYKTQSHNTKRTQRVIGSERRRRQRRGPRRCVRAPRPSVSSVVVVAIRKPCDCDVDDDDGGGCNGDSSRTRTTRVVCVSYVVCVLTVPSYLASVAGTYNNDDDDRHALVVYTQTHLLTRTLEHKHTRLVVYIKCILKHHTQYTTLNSICMYERVHDTTMRTLPRA